MNFGTDHFQKLDKEIICYITSWLEVSEIINFGLTHHYLRFLLKARSVWNLQMRNYLPCLSLVSDKFPKLSPKDLFIHVFSKYNRLIGLLSQIIQKVNADMNARKWLEDNYKKNYDKRKDLESIISESYHCIPVDYYMFFRLLDGQDMLFQHFPQDVCFFGGYSFNEKYYEFEYLPFTQPEFPLLEKLKFHTIAINRDRGIRYYVDFDNILKGGVGSIFTFLSQRNESGTIIFRIFIIKQSIFKLLQDLQPCAFSSKKRLIDHFDTLCSPQSDVTTEGIRIRAYSIFNPWEMSSSGFLFAYQIRVSANGLKGKWKLTCRHLIITDGNNQEEVEGVEVNGKAYEVHDKGEDLLYESWVYTQSLTTSMKGYLYFVNVDTNQEVRAQIGEIIMEFPFGCALLDLTQKDLSIKVLIDRMETPAN